MRFGIITHYDVHNHGALLQLNALIKVLAEHGVEAHALRFEKNYDFMGVGCRNKYDISLRSLKTYLKYLYDNGLRRTLYNIRKKRALDRFRVQEHLLGDYYTDTHGNLDAVVVGSDEVFALHTGPTPVFFGHACPSEHVFSYAGSFGPTNYEDIVDKHCLPLVASGLNAMTGISVRDRNSQEIVSRLIGRTPEIVCDPVLLYGYANEIKSFAPINLPPYMIVYAYDNNMNDKQEIAEIKDYAARKRLRIVSPGFYHSWCDCNINVDPVNLLNYFANAQCVVTDTFHGSVMSILTNRNLAVRTRGNSNKLVNLLEEYELTNRIITKDRNLETILACAIEYEKVNSELARRRMMSMEFINDMILACR